MKNFQKYFADIKNRIIFAAELKQRSEIQNATMGGIFFTGHNAQSSIIYCRTVQVTAPKRLFHFAKVGSTVFYFNNKFNFYLNHAK